MTLMLEYYIDFGECDGGDTLEWEEELSPEEEAIMKQALDDEEDLEEALKDVIDRVREYLREQEKQTMEETGGEWDDAWRVVVHIADSVYDEYEDFEEED